MRRPAAVATVALAVGLALAACGRGEGPAEPGSVKIGVVDAAVTVDCARVGERLVAEGHGMSDDLRSVSVHVEQTGTQADVVVEASGTTISASGDADALYRYVSATSLETEGDFSEIITEGTFTSFEGSTQAGDVDGELGLSCPDDGDPGGGFMTLGGTEVTFEVVTCRWAPADIEIVARSVTDEHPQLLTLMRSTSGPDWVDRLTVTGDVEQSHTVVTPRAGDIPSEAEEGLFAVRGGRVTGDATLGDAESEPMSLDLTCGLVFGSEDYPDDTTRPG